MIKHYFPRWRCLWTRIWRVTTFWNFPSIISAILAKALCWYLNGKTHRHFSSCHHWRFEALKSQTPDHEDALPIFASFSGSLVRLGCSPPFPEPSTLGVGPAITWFPGATRHADNQAGQILNEDLPHFWRRMKKIVMKNFHQSRGKWLKTRRVKSSRTTHINWIDWRTIWRRRWFDHLPSRWIQRPAVPTFHRLVVSKFTFSM